jgi:eukaryotic-like serine/threonine-protein kinase
MVGAVIGSYRITGKIGEGGMGAVYLAEHALIGRQAAIKVLLRDLSHSEELVQRFFNEARAASAVKHPGIVEIYDFGHCLAARLRRAGTLPEARAAAICRQVAGALGAAHAKGIVHRDLKPDNVFIVRDADVADGERAKVLDFGVAKLAGDQAGSVKTRTGMVMGTPAYMAPEQCKGAGRVDQRADLYALCCMLFEMVCGRPPFIAEGAGEVMAQHIYAPVPAPSSVAPVTPPLEQLLLRGLAKDPDQRYGSAQELVAALNAAVPPASFPGAAAGNATVMAPPWAAPSRPPGAPPLTTLSSAAGASPVMTAPGRQRRRKIGWLSLVAAIAAVAVGAAVSTLGGGSGTDPDGAPGVSPPRPLSELALQPPLPPELPPPPARPLEAKAEAQPPDAEVAAPAEPQADPAPAPTPTKVTMRIRSTPTGAEVYRMPQGVRVGRTPLSLAIDAVEGEVVFILKRAGFRDETVVFPADVDGDRTVTLARRTAPAPTPTPPTTTTKIEPKKPAPEQTPPAEPEKRDTGTLNPFDRYR